MVRLWCESSSKFCKFGPHSPNLCFSFTAFQDLKHSDDCFWLLQVFAAISLGALAMVTFPAISALKANNVGAGEQGQIQGALVGAQSLAAGVGPLLFSYIFKLFSRCATFSFSLAFTGARYRLGLGQGQGHGVS